MTMLNEGFAFWKAVNEAVENGTLVMTFGRFNPPTIGHKWLFQSMLNIATKERGVGLVFASHSQDKKKNPLPYEEKCDLISKLIPKGLKLVRTKARTMKEILEELMPKKFRRLILVVGDDRTSEFAWIDKYKEDFGLQKVDIRSAGARSGASAIQNASATAQREAAKAGDLERFLEYSPFDQKVSEKLFNRLQDLLK